MEALKTKRGTYKGRVTRLETVKTNLANQTVTLVAANMFLRKIDELTTSYDKLLEEIAQACNPNEYDLHETEHNLAIDRLENLHIHFAGIVYQIQQASAPPVATMQVTQQASTQGTGSNPSPDIRLPKVELPTFGGNYVEWFTFYDLFTAMVHNNSKLSGAQKFQYLKTSLKNEAALLITAIPVTDGNYPEAWDILTQRYNNPNEIIDAHIKRLFSQPSVTQESSTALRRLMDTTAESIRALKVLAEPVQHWDSILLHVVKEKLDQASRREWELSLPGNVKLTFEDLTTFLDQRARALAAAQPSTTSTKSRSMVKLKHTTVTHHGTTRDQCPLCKETHSVYRCSILLKSPISERWELLKKNALCFNCLRRGHQDKQESKVVTKEEESTEVVSNISRQSVNRSQVLLATALVQVVDSSGQLQSARALLDSASQASFITERCAQRLHLKRNHHNVSIGGIGASSIGTARSSVALEIRSSVDKGVKLKVEALILKRVTGDLPSLECDPTTWSHLQGLQLADPQFHKPGEVDILLGADVYLDIVRNGQCKGPTGTPGAFNTVFGWTISGPQESLLSKSKLHVHHCTLDQQLQKFWEIEEIPYEKKLTAVETQCEEHFVKTHTRDDNGRYVVRLPLNRESEVLGNSRDQAVRRFLANERRQQSKPDLYDQYRTFMKEYEALGHMELINHKELPNDQLVSNYYLPHHGVIKETSTTTKLRVVFDGSAKTSTGISLNDIMMVGPKLQEDLVKLLIRFRFNLIAMTADLEKMYRQILVHREDTNLQRIVWRNNSTEPIQDYRLLTVTYGTASAPYLAVKTLQQLAQDEKSEFPLAYEALTQDFYVDDLMSGENSLSKALELQSQLIKATSKGGFQLRKWASNEPSLLQSVPADLREIEVSLNIDKDESIKTLGLYWHPASDRFTFIVTSPSSRPQVSKRTILSDISKVFDPLGLIAPIIIRAKILMQEMWRQKKQWDEELPPIIIRKWQEFREELAELESISVERHISQADHKDISIQGFCDASERAYAAVVYLRTSSRNGQTKTQVIASKTRVAPLKPLTIARLELCGAVLLANLIQLILEALKLKKPEIHCWSDSTTVLAWLASPPSRWKTFVANRVATIQETLPSAHWHHIPGTNNPADCASRGIHVKQLQDLSLWWHGPICLDQYLSIRDELNNEPEECLYEEKQTQTITAFSQIDTTLLSKYSSLTNLIHVTAYILRFVHNTRNGTSRRHGPLTKLESDLALSHWIKASQQECFSNEIQNLRQDKPLSSKSKLLCLRPYLDKDDVLRVGGRLRHAKLPIDQIHPAILPRQNKLTELIINHEHLKYFHGGSQLILTNLQKRYWIIGARDAIRYHIRRCIRCVRHQATTMQQLMGDLPSARVNPARAFLKCGVDYAGPFLLKVIKGRGHKMFKAYIAVFVCFTTRALHFELVSDMSTNAFIAALKRFVSRRGKPSDIFSDCGTNFVGANRELKDFIKHVTTTTSNDQIARWLADQSITWHFNPPGAPHFGGIWEAGVKSVKHHLKRVMGQHNLTYEEMETLLCQIEACLNSRPLTALTSDPDDLQALTPGHFLIGDSLTAVPEEDLTSEKINRLTRWQLGQNIFQHFWKRWQNEYLTRLQQRPKWAQTRKDLQVGDLVLLKDENLPPTKWKLSRIVDLHPGADGHVRVATVKTSEKTFQRPIVKLCPLPID